MQLTALELFARLDSAGVAEHVDKRQFLVPVLAGLVIQGEDDRAEQAILQLGELVHRHVEFGGHLGHRRHPAELGGELLLGGLEPASEQTNRAGGPVGGADRVEDGAPDALRSEPLEGHTPALVVAT